MTKSNYAPQPFWSRRAGTLAEPTAAAPPAPRPAPQPGQRLIRSPALSVSPEPCVVGDFIEMHPAVHHPSLDRPVAFLGPVALATVLEALPATMGLDDLFHHVASRIDASYVPTVVRWLVEQSLVERCP